MPDVFLYAGEANPNDVILSDPTVTRSVALVLVPGAAVLIITTFAPNSVISISHSKYIVYGAPISLEIIRPPYVTTGRVVPQVFNQIRRDARRAAEDAARVQSENN